MKSKIGFFLIGIVVGVVVFAVGMFILIPKMMLTIHESRYSTVEETCQRLEASAEDNGWSVPEIRDMNAAIEKHGSNLGRKVKIVELCKATLAKDILETNPEVSTLMPCAWGVYKGDDGKVYISGMNMIKDIIK